MEWLLRRSRIIWSAAFLSVYLSTWIWTLWMSWDSMIIKYENILTVGKCALGWIGYFDNKYFSFKNLIFFLIDWISQVVPNCKLGLLLTYWIKWQCTKPSQFCICSIPDKQPENSGESLLRCNHKEAVFVKLNLLSDARIWLKYFVWFRKHSHGDYMLSLHRFEPSTTWLKTGN